jgi:hypothetical protein
MAKLRRQTIIFALLPNMLWLAGCKTGGTKGVTQTAPTDEPPAVAARGSAPGDPSSGETVQEAPEGGTQNTEEAWTPTPLEESWGIRILGLRLSAGGYMLDFRYRVLDPTKAAPLLDRSVKPHLIDQASGAKVIVPSPPKIGPLRTTQAPQAGRSYFVIFANPGVYIERGSKVTVVIGDFRAEDLTVE